jgi:hypothetical protein
MSVGIIFQMLNLQHQHNKSTTPPYMKVGPSVWGPSSCEEVLCICCDGVVQESNPFHNSSIFADAAPHHVGTCLKTKKKKKFENQR